METRHLEHDPMSLRAASLYWQSIVLMNTSLILLSISLVERIVYFTLLHIFDTRLPTLSPASGSTTWPYLAGMTLLALTVLYRLLARRFFSRSEATKDLDAASFIPVMAFPKHPFAVRHGDIITTWNLPR